MGIIYMKNTKLVTHKDCLDGSACSILFQRAGGLKENIIYTVPSHNATDEVIDHLIYNWEGPIIFADVSFSEQWAEKIDKFRMDVMVFDHHEAANYLAKYKWCHIDEDNLNCGSKVFLDWLSKKLHLVFTTNEWKFVDIVDDVDRWIWNSPWSEDLSILHKALGQELFVERFVKDIFPKYSNTEKYVIKLEKYKSERHIEEKVRQTQVFLKRVDGKKLRIGIVDASKNISEIGNKLCKDVDLNLDFAVVVGSKSVSFRSTGKRNVCQIAQLNGGGGHKLAAGCPIKNVLGKPLLNLIIEGLKLEVE